MATVTFKENPVTLVGDEVKVGDQAPNFTVLSNSMQEVSLSDYEGSVKLISVVPSIDTGVCDAQTRKFNEEAGQLDNVKVLTISMDLPFAQRRWCGANGIEDVDTLSDHRDAYFGEAFGVLIKEMRLLTRAVFVVDSNNEIVHVEYVPEATNHPDYDAAMDAVRSAQ
ncbi:lipid hydroperoxide peroxidase [Pontibacillus halophilus JSM 076056 = DSM 19796]|uniref:Thiol peroxidase n=1 Tax=Pontibacillus halophilus JSM 076056 = DSM 19796 TaxID=1385510 RepID=A0A0A5GQA1_9BACI|nr:thiol peroxidase [Pontibacillus halophilus]KGX93350.1 lipid hydroperoxide peroxidase [Pontibacillus halophilus JSM 076056 = DSM 19796]